MRIIGAAAGARRRGVQRILGPRVARIAAPQLAPQRRVVALPEAREVRGHLHRALVGREQVQHQRHAPARQRGPAAMPKKSCSREAIDGACPAAYCDA